MAHHGVAGRVDRRQFLELARAAVAGLASDRILGARTARAAAPEDSTGTTLRLAAEALRAGRMTSVDLTAACLARIGRLQGTLNAFVTVVADQALADARARDAELRRGQWRGALHGVPVALKDNIDTAGIRTTAASAVFADRIPTEDAEVVRRLRVAGAIIVGKLNMDEFAAGGSSVVSYFNPVHNPWAPDHSAGGSSGGAGAAVAAGLVFAALGTDTVGSLRIPAAFCSVVGLKPTYGRVSARGVIPLSWTFDHVGPVARSVDDVALVLGVIAGHDPLDLASVDAPVPDYVAEMRTPVSTLRVGLPRGPYYDKLDADVEGVVQRALDVIGRLVDSTHDVALPPVLRVGSVIAEEMAAYHAQWFGKVAHLYQIPTRRRLKEWSALPATDYILARREVARLRREAPGIFRTVDLLVTPTAKIPPRTIEESLKRAESETPRPPELGATIAFNLLGLPAISVPCGFTPAGLPVGLQIVGPPFGEGRVLALAGAYEQATEWHRRRPRLSGTA